MQISIQQRLTGLPEFRLHIINNAHAEGRAVYAEALGKEIGFFLGWTWYYLDSYWTRRQAVWRFERVFLLQS